MGRELAQSAERWTLEVEVRDRNLHWALVVPYPKGRQILDDQTLETDTGTDNCQVVDWKIPKKFAYLYKQ